MKRIHVMCLTAAFFLTAFAVSAQDQLAFTGTWTRLDVSPSPDSFHIERIAQKSEQITVQVESKSSFGSLLGSSYRGDHTYTIGGPAESKRDADGRVRSVAVSWDGPKLVFIRTTTEGANTTTEREAWSLTDGGDMLFKDRRTTDWRGTRDERIVSQRSEGKPGGFQVYGAAGKSCRAWISERGGTEGAASLQWVLGYVTGYGVDRGFRIAAGGDTSGKLRPTDAEEIGQIIDKYCGERHPDSDLWRAADDLIRQLGGTRPVPPPPMREYR
jgi:hypothetical protein